jgi:hypothetical protein
LVSFHQGDESEFLMASLFGEVRAVFEVVGEMVDRRIVTSDKQKDWKLHILKVAAKGATIEVQATEQQFNEAVLKAPYLVTGYITVENGRTKLIAEQAKQLTTAKSA